MLRSENEAASKKLSKMRLTQTLLKVGLIFMTLAVVVLCMILFFGLPGDK